MRTVILTLVVVGIIGWSVLSVSRRVINMSNGVKALVVGRKAIMWKIGNIND